MGSFEFIFSQFNLKTKICMKAYSIAAENYLSIISNYLSPDGKIKPNIIASKLSISNAAVTDMMKKLAKEGLIVYTRYKGIELTVEGKNIALKIIRRRRIWEVYLYQILGMPLDKVYDEAGWLSHSSSDYVINRLEDLLNFPNYDPHGYPIPSKDGRIPKLKTNYTI